MAASLKFLTVPAVTKHTATVIFVHGLGDTGHGWKPVADMFKSDPTLQHIKWILPHAPTLPVTANYGMEMPAWFDIKAFGFKAPEDENGMKEASKSLSQLIATEVADGLDPSRIVLGGFSQGGAMALLTGLTGDNKLAGLVVLSGWLPIKDTVKSTLSSDAKSLPIFVGHGTADPLIKIEHSEASIDFLKSLGFSVTESSSQYKIGIVYNRYQGLTHSAHPKELEDWKAWLKQALPKTDA